MKKLMTPQEVCDYFKITIPTQIAWRKAGLLPEVIRMKKRIYYREEEITNINTIQVPKNQE
jgi:predicted site-specific integrase-resolvase